MKKIFVCGILLGLLTTVSFAQRGRAAGGVGPAAGIPTTGTIAPNARIPDAATINRGVSPSAVPTSPHAPIVGPNVASHPDTPTVSPNAASGGNSKTVAPNAESAPDHVISPNANTTTSPDARTLPDAHTGTGPIQ